MNRTTKIGETWIHYKKGWLPLTYRPEKKEDDEIQQKVQGVPEGFVTPAALLSPTQLSMRDAWKKIIVARKNAKVLFTMGFKVQCGNEEAISSTNFFLKAINRSLFNHRYGKDPKAGLKGMCICEPHMLSYDFRGQLHFHMLLDDIPELKNVDTFRQIVHEEMRRVVTLDGEHMLDESVVDVREIWDIEELADYLTKTARMYTWKTMDNICFVEPKGLTGICISYQKNARNY